MAAPITGTRNTSGDGTAVLDPGATGKVHVSGVQQMQSEATGVVTMILKVGTTPVARVYCPSAGQGLVTKIDYTGAVGEKLYVNLSDNISCGYVLNAVVVGG